ncbi:hypothetical protein CR513_00972, partial [Mucuna pruriens]
MLWDSKDHLRDIGSLFGKKNLSQFASADNGASAVIGAYLEQASTSFNELDQLLKELNLSHSHKKAQKAHNKDS